MVKILPNEITCKHCQHHLSYEDDDVQTRKVNYNYLGMPIPYDFNYIVCPYCLQEVQV